MQRRSFMLACLSTLAGATLVPGGMRTATAASGDSADAVMTIGQWYLQNFPQESEVSHLLELLERSVPGVSAHYMAGDLKLDPVVVRRACGDDFATGDTEFVKGWLMARTELRLCALAAALGAQS